MKANSAPLPSAALRIAIDSGALANNFRDLDRLSGEAKTGAAVKADCYGLGVDMCVPVLRDAGAAGFFVAHWNEVAGVAAHVDPAMISVLHGPGNAAEAVYARAIGVLPVINSIPQARLWVESGGGPCDLMVDTGINRLGVALADIGDPVLQRLEVSTLMSHLASADEDTPSNQHQRKAFADVVQAIPADRASLANSAGIGLGKEYACDLTRPGLALYGGVPHDELAGKIRQVAFPQVSIIQTRNLQEGDCVGYNAEFTASQPMKVAVVSLGYADGFLRCLGPDGSLTSEDRQLPLLGKVSMDMVVVDLGPAPELQEGDWLDVPYSLPETSRRSGLSQYELLTILGSRYQRYNRV